MEQIVIGIFIFLFFAGLFVVFSMSLFKRIVCRKHPQPGTMEFEKREIQLKTGDNTYWIDSVTTEIAEITSFDGLQLKGFYKTGKDSNMTAILFHGYTGDARQLSPVAQYISEKYGCNILMPHHRTHGWSEGRYIGFGWFESDDCIKWIDWIKNKTTGEDARILLIGTSMGAATVLIAAGLRNIQKEVKAVIADCSFTSAKEEIRYQIKGKIRFDSKILLNFIDFITKKRAGYSFAQSSPINAVKNIKIPILFVHGKADKFTPISMTNELFGSNPGYKELFTVENAGHGESYAMNKNGYQEKINKLFASFFGGDPHKD